MHFIPSLSLSIICLYICSHESSSSSLPQTTSYGYVSSEIRSSEVCFQQQTPVDRDLLIMVYTEPGNVNERNSIRAMMRLWKSEKTTNVRVVFFMEQPLATQDYYQNVLLEEGVNNDIVWLILPEESDDQSREKRQLSYHWMTYMCNKAKFVLIVQDDAIINLSPIMDFINDNRNANKTIWTYSDQDMPSRYQSTVSLQSDSTDDDCTEKACLLTGDTVGIIHSHHDSTTPNANEINGTSTNVKNEGIRKINDKKFKVLDPLFLVYDDYFHSRRVQYNHNCQYLQRNHYLYKSPKDREEVLYLLWTLTSPCQKK